VQYTYDFLKELPWTSVQLRRVPEIAWAHHEKLDGSGYPQKLTEDDIPIQSKMMTISDIYDALVARDRPYKDKMEPQEALDILKKEEAGERKIDKDLLEIFIGARIHEKTANMMSSTAEEVETAP
jgi:HD-GYP domain-containing protein (c-di-GMP phosphodiesterase class II)